MAWGFWSFVNLSRAMRASVDRHRQRGYLAPFTFAATAGSGGQGDAGSAGVGEALIAAGPDSLLAQPASKTRDTSPAMGVRLRLMDGR